MMEKFQELFIISQIGTERQFKAMRQLICRTTEENQRTIGEKRIQELENIENQSDQIFHQTEIKQKKF